ncbi:MAG: hypothetical protein PHO63_00280 [Bacilli bacterium]|nr:hypothetical protein [Bacilli bacterium]MDD4808693.1 hypothetical protein [Bacilli bacterium]
MEFITENLVWVIVIGIVILMTIIGYLAEKTDFGRKSIERRELRAKIKAEQREKERQENLEKALQKEKELAEKKSQRENVDNNEVPTNEVTSPKEEAVIVQPEPTNEKPKKEKKKKEKKKKKGKNDEAESTTVEAIGEITPEEPQVTPDLPTVESVAPVAVEPSIEATNLVEVNPELPVMPNMPTTDPVNPVVNDTPIQPAVAEEVETLVIHDINPSIDVDNQPEDIANIVPNPDTLPDIEKLQSTKPSSEAVEEDDDVWKF